MSWNIHEKTRGTKTYIYLKKNVRVGKKVKSSYIYLGPARNAAKILGELQIKPLVSEKEISYSGEIILGMVANSISFSKILEKYTGDRHVANVLSGIVILRTLFPESKRKLVKLRLEHSILKESTDLRYLEEVYRFMDVIYDDFGDIMYDMVRNALKNHSLDIKYLIIDATRIKIWKDEETGLVRFGYSSKKERKNLPQANLILGVNNQQVPIFANTYPGNTPDVKMFQDFIHRINTRYRELTRRIEEKFMIFDQGNVNKNNIEYLRELKKEGIYFISKLKTSSASRFIETVDKSAMPLIYSKEKSKNMKTEIYGELIEGKVYGKMSKMAVCYNPDIMKQKSHTLDRRVESVKQMVEQGDSIDEIKAFISKYNIKRVLKPIETIDGIELDINKKEIENRKNRYGFFILFTEHPKISADKILEIYKSRDVVEDGFRVVKTDLEINPVYHSKDMRIECHIVLVIFGYFLLSLLRAILRDKGIKHSFEGLKETITSGNAVEGFYEHEKLKNRLYIWRPIKPKKELKEIFEVLKIKVPIFDVKECVPTNSRRS
ncbi:MAG: transposase [Euryarchaeota archaeon]|nr:transposase [Euryarchaeota archaeon]